MSVGLVVLVVKVLDWVGSVAGGRVVLELDVRIDEEEGATVVSCWCSVDEEAQPMVWSQGCCCWRLGWWKEYGVTVHVARALLPDYDGVLPC